MLLAPRGVAEPKGFVPVWSGFAQLVSASSSTRALLRLRRKGCGSRVLYFCKQ